VSDQVSGQVSEEVSEQVSEEVYPYAGMGTDDWPFRHRLVVRFRDCDAMGHVNHAVYFTYFEQCRFALWRHLGGGSGLPGAGTIMVHAECDYRAPAFVHDELEIGVRLTAIGRSSFTFEYEIVNVAAGRPVAVGKTVNVTYDYQADCTIPIPDLTRTQLTRVAARGLLA
jgi:acyl-CoA thioester hydrolase